MDRLSPDQLPTALKAFISDKKSAPAIKADLAARQVTADELDLVKQTVAKDATDAELKLYLYDCQRLGVHPLDKLLHFTKRAGRYTPITSIDFMRQRAAETGEYAGSDDAIFGDEEGLPAHPVSATVTVWRLVQSQRCAFTATARWAEYKPDQAFMWNKMPFTMLSKCAEALALRKGFPRQLAGLYAKEEMDQAERGTDAPQKPAPPRQAAPSATIAAAPVLPPVPPHVDPQTGEDYGPPPEGARWVMRYEWDGTFHKGWLSGDTPHGLIEVWTKYEKGETLKAAFDQRKPIVAKWSKTGLLDSCGWWVKPTGPIAKALSKALREDEPPIEIYEEEPFS